MRRWLKNSLRFLLVTAGIVVLTSLGIDASQYLSGSNSALGILADRATEGACPRGMSFIENGTDDFCMDTYEVSPSNECQHKEPGHFSQTAENLSVADCTPVSEASRLPWIHVTYHQARELCAKAGKRLPNHQEWYTASLGLNDTQCGVDENALNKTGVHSQCRSSAGVFDMVGNAWEWIAAESSNGMYENRSLPETGFVLNADADGVALQTTQNPQISFHHDYFWSNSDGTFAMMRGGFYGSGDDAGIYAVHADVDANFSGSAIGFRCATDA